MNAEQESNLAPKEAPPLITPPTTNNEKIFLKEKDVTITDKRMILKSRTYAIKHIASFGVIRNFNGPKIPALIFGIPASLITIFSGIIFIISTLLFQRTNPEVILISLWGLSFFLTFIFGGIWLSKSGRRHTLYCVEITTSSGREQALNFANEESAQSVCAAINEAIVNN